MKKWRRTAGKSLAAALLAIAGAGGVAYAQQQPPRQMENLGRGVIALNEGGGKVFVSWRLLGTDPANISFNIYRDDIKLNDKPISTSTNFLDSNPLGKPAAYAVRPIIDNHEGDARPALYLPGPYLEIPLKTPQGYSPNDASVGDLDGDNIVATIGLAQHGTRFLGDEQKRNK